MGYQQKLTTQISFQREIYGTLTFHWPNYRRPGRSVIAAEETMMHHSQANRNEMMSFWDTAAGKECKRLGLPDLPKDKLLDGTPWSPPTTLNGSGSNSSTSYTATNRNNNQNNGGRQQNTQQAANSVRFQNNNNAGGSKKKNTGKQGEFIEHINDTNTDGIEILIPSTLTIKDRVTSADILIDSGATKDNYIDASVLDKLKNGGLMEEDVIEKVECSKLICGAICKGSSTCTCPLGRIKLKITFNIPEHLRYI